MSLDNVKLSIKNLDLFYGDNQALKDINIDIKENKVTALIGPSGCGKSTFLRTLNRMNDLIENVTIKGKIEVDGEDIYQTEDVIKLRTKVGMVFQKPNPFPMSIYDNIAYGPRIHGIRDKKILDKIVEESLRGAAIWDEVKDRLKTSALGLSGGQQQRICIARAIAMKPEVILMDEPFKSLDIKCKNDIIAIVKKINLEKKTTIILVTHDKDEILNLAHVVFLLGERPVKILDKVKENNIKNINNIYRHNI